MKKTTKACLLISLIMLLVGGSMIFFALSRAEFNWNKLMINVENETFDYAVPGMVQDIVITSKQADVHVLRSSNDSSTVRAKIASRSGCSVETNDGVLTVTCTDDPSLPWYRQ